MLLKAGLVRKKIFVKVHLVLSWVLWALLVIWLLFLVAAILILWVIELPATYKLMNHLQYWVAIDILVNGENTNITLHLKSDFETLDRKVWTG